MAETINLPKIGPVKKSYVYAGGAAAGAYVAWRWWQHGLASEGVADEEIAPAPESVGTIGADIGSGAGGYYNPRPDGQQGDGLDPADTVINNQQWSALALEWLVNAGYSEQAASNALGKYLQSQPLSASEQVMIQVALAFAGKPPFPPAGPAGGGDPPSPSTPGAPKNLRGNGSPTPASVPLRWDPAGGAAGYNVYRSGDGTLEPVAQVSGTTFTVTGLKAGTAYGFTVRARNSAGTTGPASNRYSATTARTAEPKPTPTPAPSGTPPHRTMRITRRNQSLSDLVAEHNRRYGGRNPSWQEVWAFNLKYRAKATQATLRKRGPHKVYIGSSFMIPK